MNVWKNRFLSGCFDLCYRRSRKWSFRCVNYQVKNGLAEDVLERTLHEFVHTSYNVPTVAKRFQERQVVADTCSSLEGKSLQKFYVRIVPL